MPEMELIPDVLLETVEADSTPISPQFDADTAEIKTDIEPLDIEPQQILVSNEQVSEPEV